MGTLRWLKKCAGLVDQYVKTKHERVEDISLDATTVTTAGQ
jgi:hypothetical protein